MEEPTQGPLGRALARSTEAGVDPRVTARFAVYALVGVCVGLAVVTIEWLAIEQALEELLHAPLWVQAVVPGLGLAVTAVILHLSGITASTSDEYIRVFHSGDDLPPEDLAPKLTASMATIGAGGAVGLEGPAIYAGATIGQMIGRRATRLLGPRGARMLTAAGAAAGVAAVFQAPATGVLFALETPFQRDVARRALIPALISASAAYLTFVSVFGAHPLIPIESGEVRLRDEVIGALVLGLLGGLTARVLAAIWLRAKSLSKTGHPALRVLVGGAVLAAGLAGARGLTGESFTLGPGAVQVAAVATDPKTGLWVIAGAFVLRTLVTAGTFGAGGVGGLFIPLVVQGLLLGRLVEALFDSPTPGLYPVIGLAAVLGAGYRTPLAAVMFVAETTGRAEFVIPALLATAVSQGVMGDASVSSHQVHEREGLLERRMRLPVRDVALEVPVLDPQTPVTEVIDTYGIDPPAPALPVGKDRYVGLLFLRDVAAAMFEHGPDATVADVMIEVPPVHVTALAVEAARIMGDEDSAVIAVVDDDGRPLGVVTALTMTGVADYDPDE